MMRIALLLLGLAAGCAPSGSFARIPNQDRAEQVVWRDLYGMLDDAPPAVEWVDGCWGSDGLTCGFTWIGWKIQVALHADYLPEDAPISLTTYAHELMHYATYLRTGDVDAYHWRGDWELADQTAVFALVHEGM